MKSSKSPNQNIMPVSAGVTRENVLTLGGVSTEVLARDFGTPLWIMCQDTIEAAAREIMDGLRHYPAGALPCYAGKAFLCTAMAKLVDKLGFGLDVVSKGEIETALAANFKGSIYLHGNNKTDEELALAVKHNLKVVADNRQDLERLAELHGKSGTDSQTEVLLRIIPGIDLDTHDHIKTGHDTSKFGIPLSQLNDTIAYCLGEKSIKLLGLHAHIGSQAMDLEPFQQVIEVFADIYEEISKRFSYVLPHLDIGGGLGIAYVESDRPIALEKWTRTISEKMVEAFQEKRGLPLPSLSIEPGRCLVGTAGVTLYRVGRMKQLEQINYLSVDGGMADNPRPITYQAAYTAMVANRMEPREEHLKTWTIVGRYCESGDIIVEEAKLDAAPGDIIAIFATGAYNYSMASNYNRTARPACVLVKDGHSDLMIAPETEEDLLRLDRIPSWLK